MNTPHVQPAAVTRNDQQTIRAGYSLAGVLLVCVTVALGLFGVFVLPYTFPLTTPLYDSPAYNVGFNTSVAIASLLMTIAALTFLEIRCRPLRDDSMTTLFARPRKETASPDERMPLAPLFAAIAMYSLFHGFFYYAIPSLDEYAEAGFNLRHLELAIRCGQFPYEDVCYPYGPLCYYLPFAFITIGSWLGLSIGFSYFVALVCSAAGGLAILFWLVDTFNVDVISRTVAFMALATATYETGMGTASTMVRYATPFALLVLGHYLLPVFERRSRTVAMGCQAGYSGMSTLIALGVSAEFGIVFAVARAVYCLHRGMFAERSAMGGVIGLLAAFPVWMALFPGSLFRVLSSPSGFINFPILPGIHILTFLFGTLWAVPKVLRACATMSPPPNAGLALSWAALGVGLTPAALGRCEFAHVILNGMGLFLLAMMAMAKTNRRLFLYGMACFVLVHCCVMRVVEIVDAAPRFIPIRMALGGQRVVPQEEDSNFIVLKEALRLEELRGVGIPLGASRPIRQYLIETGRYALAYYPDYTQVASARELERKLEDLGSAEFLLVPESIFGLRGVSDDKVIAYRQQVQAQTDKQMSIWLGTLFLLPYTCESKYLPFDPQFEESRYIANHYRPIRSSGGWAIAVKDEGVPQPSGEPATRDP